VLLVEGPVGLPDGEDEVEQFAHAMADGDVSSLDGIWSVAMKVGSGSGAGRL
jgi:hypothetical protein